MRHSPISRFKTRRRQRHLALAGLSAVLLSACGGDSGSDNDAGAPVAAMACADFANQTIGAVRVTAATAIPATDTQPAHCLVSGTEVGTAHDIEVRLPQDWRGRYVQQGGGGFDGSIPSLAANNVALAEGAVLTANNGGHRDPSGGALLNDTAAVERYAHAAILTAAKFGKAVAAEYYGQAPRYAYYQGCSNGGRGALNAAAKYGDEFDAVIAGAPTMNLAGQIAQWTRASSLALPSAEKLAAVSAAAIAQCDTLDGARDGIVSNWAACRFDPTTDVPAAAGLTPAEALAVQALMQDLTLSNGTTIYAGYGQGQLPSSIAALGVGHMRNIVMNDANWDPANFSVDSDYPGILAVIDERYQFNASVAGLTHFLQQGKKIMLWHGADDGLLSHHDILRSWQDVQAAAGRAADNAKVYIAAGVEHCSGGVGADRFDLLRPMMDWVEHGVAPGALTATRVQANAVTLTRPLCEYPAYAKYHGTGDVNLAASFSCSID